MRLERNNLRDQVINLEEDINWRKEEEFKLKQNMMAKQKALVH